VHTHTLSSRIYRGGIWDALSLKNNTVKKGYIEYR
jgi:hypothetical protein